MQRSLYHEPIAISLTDLANRCEKSESYIGEIEKGRKTPSLKVLEVIAQELQVKPYQLLRDEDLKFDLDRSVLLDKLQEKLNDNLPDNIKKIIHSLRKE